MLTWIAGWVGLATSTVRWILIGIVVVAIAATILASAYWYMTWLENRDKRMIQLGQLKCVTEYQAAYNKAMDDTLSELKAAKADAENARRDLEDLQLRIERREGQLRETISRQSSEMDRLSRMMREAKTSCTPEGRAVVPSDVIDLINREVQ